MTDETRHANGEPPEEGTTSMGQCAGDAIAASWFLAAVQGPAGDHADHADGTHPDVIISVSLDELDGLSGDMLV